MAVNHLAPEDLQARMRRTVSTLLRSSLAASVFVSVLVFLGLIGLGATGNLETPELAAYDWLLRFRSDTAQADARIVLITVTESDIRWQGTWPLPDATLAQTLALLTQYQPRAIGLDMFRDVPVPPGHEALEAILTSNPRIIAAMIFGPTMETSVLPPPVLRQTEQVGFVDIVVDPGGIVRRGLLFLDDGNTTFYSFALRLALLYLRAEGIVPQPDPAHPEHLRLGQTTIRPLAPNDGGYVNADARGYQFLLDFRRRHTFPTFSLQALLSGEVDPAVIRDKIVLIGVTAVSVKDAFFTPYSRGMHADQQMPGVALHAYAISQLLRGGLDGDATIATVSDQYEGLWMLLWGVLGVALGYRIRSPWRLALAGAGCFLVLGLVGYGALRYGWWIPVVPPTLAWGFSAAGVTACVSYQEKAQRMAVVRIFSQHVSEQVVDALLQQQEQLLAGGRARPRELTATVLFSDLEGFTSVSEKLRPKELLDWLNDYMAEVAEQVILHHGMINKYIGDSIMALFGVERTGASDEEIGQDAVRAVQCALAMEKALRQLNQQWQEQDLPTIGMRIGIFTGPLVVGSLGSAHRLEYTVLGDTVNTASRLESFDKHVLAPHTTGSPCRILIGEATLRYLGGQFQTQKVGEVHLKGKEETVTIYRLIGWQDSQISSGKEGESV